MAPRFRHARSLSLREPGTVGCRLRIRPALKEPAFITAQLLLRRSYAAAKKSLSLAVEIPQARLLYFWRRAQATCTCSSEVLALLTPCRNISFDASNRRRISAC